MYPLKSRMIDAFSTFVWQPGRDVVIRNATRSQDFWSVRSAPVGDSFRRTSPWNCEPKHATSCNKHQQTSWKGESPSIAFINGSIFSFTFSFHRYSLSQQAELGVAFSEHPLLLLALTGLERLKHDPLRAVGSRSRCDLSVVPRASLCIGKWWPWIGREWWLPDIFQQRWTPRMNRSVCAFKKWFHSANDSLQYLFIHLVQAATSWPWPEWSLRLSNSL